MSVATFIYRQIYCRYLCPGECIISDSGSEWVNEVNTILSESFGVSFVITRPGNAKSNGLAEGAVKTLKNKMKALMSENCNFNILMMKNYFLNFHLLILFIFLSGRVTKRLGSSIIIPSTKYFTY